MFPKLAANLFHLNLQRAAVSQTHASQFRTVFQFTPSYPSPLPPTPVQPGSLLSNSHPSNTKDNRSGSRAGGAGNKSNPGSKFYEGYTGPGRAVTQANAITSLDSTVEEVELEDFEDEVEFAVAGRRHSKDTISLVRRAAAKRSAGSAQSSLPSTGTTSPTSDSFSLDSEGQVVNVRERRNSFALGNIGPGRRDRAASTFGILNAVQSHARLVNAFERRPLKASPLSQTQSATLTTTATVTPPSSEDIATVPWTVFTPAANVPVQPSQPPSSLAQSWIRRLGRVSRSEAVAEVTKFREAFANDPSLHSIEAVNAALHALHRSYAHGQPINLVLELYNDAINNNIVPRPLTYKYVVIALCRRDHDLHVSLEAKESTLRRDEVLGLPTTRQHRDKVEEQITSESNFESAMSLFNASISQGYYFDTYTCNLLLRSAASAKDVYSAITVFAHLELGHRHKPDYLSYHYLMKAHVDCGDSRGAHEIFRDWVDRVCVTLPNVTADQSISIWNEMISQYFKTGQPEKALGVLAEMLDHDGSLTSHPLPTRQTYSTVIRGFCDLGETDQAIVWMQRLMRDAPKEDVAAVVSMDVEASEEQLMQKEDDTMSVSDGASEVASHTTDHSMLAATSPVSMPSMVAWYHLLHRLHAEKRFNQWVDLMTEFNATRDPTSSIPSFILTFYVGMCKEELNELRKNGEPLDGQRANEVASIMMTGIWKSDPFACLPIQVAAELMAQCGRFDDAVEIIEQSMRAKLVAISRVDASAKKTKLANKALRFCRSTVEMLTRPSSGFIELGTINQMERLKVISEEAISRLGPFITTTSGESLDSPARSGEFKAVSLAAFIRDRQSALTVGGSPSPLGLDGWQLYAEAFAEANLTRPVPEIAAFAKEFGTFVSQSDPNQWLPWSLMLIDSLIKNPGWLTAEAIEELVKPLGAEAVRRLHLVDGRLHSPQQSPAPASPVAQHPPPVLYGPAVAAPFPHSSVNIDFRHSRNLDEAMKAAISPATFRHHYKPHDLYQVFEQAAQQGIFPSPDVLARLISHVCREGSFERVKNLYRYGQVLLASLEADRQWQAQGWFQIENAMINACAVAGDVESANLHRNRIIEHGGAPSADSYASLIVASKSFTDDATIASSLFAESQQLGVQPNVYLFNTVISKLSRARRADDALELFSQMKRQGIRPTSVTYGALIGACARVGDDASAKFLFSEMRSMPNFKPRVPPYNTMMQLYTHVKPDREQALHYYNAMLREGVRPSAHTYKLLLDAYGTIEPIDLTTMESTFDTLVNDPHVQVQGTHWASKINAWGCAAKDLDQAVKVFESIELHPSSARSPVPLPDSIVYEALTNVFVAHHRMDLVTRYVERLRQAHIHMTAYVANVMIKGYASVGDMERARGVFEQLSDPPSGYAAVNNHASHETDHPSNVPAEAPVYREPSSWEAMVRAELGAGERDRALDLLRRMEDRHYPEGVVNRIRGILGGEEFVDFHHFDS